VLLQNVGARGALLVLQQHVASHQGNVAMGKICNGAILLIDNHGGNAARARP
jgi:hypothetical protein